jgi:hypothetical protein
MNDLILLKEKIERLNKFHQVEIMKILHSHNEVTLNENNNGIFVNLSTIDKSIINEIKEYLEYVNTIQDDFNDIEMQKNLLTNKYFKGNKDNNLNILSHEQS